ncbi:MAG TPA: biopolymer transporter ExbD [Bdellovibrionota bacterium]|nr:biopolymer transporter ExbD [Bdellovibrionota bacterium]
MNFKKNKKDQPSLIDIAPLIDVVFLLLIFFMVSSTFISAPGIKIDLPEATSKEIVHQKEDVTIVMRFNNEIILNQKLVTMDELKVGLEETAKKDSKALVIIQADAGVSHGKVVQVMDLARAAGLNQLAIATKPKG